MCLVTTQQPSGPDSLVARFFRRSPFPLVLGECRKRSGADNFTQIIQQAGLRFNKTIGQRLDSNLNFLETGGWPIVKEVAKRLGEQRSREPKETDKPLERWAAKTIDGALGGFGPKQSRNLWQHLGLTRYEIPLDSRVARRLKEWAFPLAISANLLADEHYYNFVLDGVQTVCQASNVLPCVLDAAIFASYDPEWNDYPF